MSSLTRGVRNLYHRLYPSIRFRVTAPFLITITVTAAIGVYVVTQLVAGSIQERLNNQLVSSARAAASAAADIEQQQLAALRSMAFTEGLAAAVVAEDQVMIDRLLRPIAANVGASHVVIYDIEGEGIVAIQRFATLNGVDYGPAPAPEIDDWPGVNRVISGEVDLLGDKYADLIPRDDLTTIYISAPVADDDNVLVGGISLGIDSQDFSRRMSEQSLSSVTLYDHTGRVLGTTFPELVNEELVLGEDQIASLRTAADSINPIEQMNYGGLFYQVLYAPLEIRSEVVGLTGVALQVDFVTDRISSSRDTFALLFAGLFVIIMVLGMGVSRSIVAPVQRLVNTTQAIQSGDLSRRVGLRIPDELGKLSQSFDHMTDQLVARNREIEHLYREQLQETAQRQAILTSISDALVVMNAAGEIFLTNPAADHLIQTLADDPKAMQIFKLICRQPEKVLTPRTLALVNRHFSVLAQNVYAADGTRLGNVVAFHDITSMVEAEKLKDRIVLQISHELRTPLTAASGYVDLLEMMGADTMPDNQMRFVKETQNHMGVLQRMVNQVVEVSAIISGRFEIIFEPVDLSAIVVSVHERLKSTMQERNLEIELLLLSNEQACIEADYKAMDILIENLMHNAYHYTLPHGQVQVRMERTTEVMTVKIIDSGVGIDEDEIDQVFEQLYRGRSADAGPTDARGMGLGLYFAKYIVEAHGGVINLYSERNVGTEVSFTLPVRQQDPDRSVSS